MKIGFAIPWLHGIRGNKVALSLAAAVADRGHSVEVFSHTVRQSLIPEIERFLGSARLTFIVRSSRAYRGPRDDLGWQLSPRRDNELARLIVKSHQHEPLDCVLLAANEGHHLARGLSGTLHEERPLLGWSVMELLDHSVLLRRERPFPLLRSLTAPLYPAVHWAWRQSLMAYDFVCPNSAWTGEILEYLYGITCGPVLVSIPVEAYDPGIPPSEPVRPPYIALATASLGPTERGLVAELADLGIRMVSYGPREVQGTLHLGYLPEAQMRGVLQGAAASLFLFDYEGLGLIPFESLAVGTPVITLPKLAVHKQWLGNAHVTFASSPSQLANACQRRLASPPSAADRSAARDTVLEFAAPKTAAMFLSYLEGMKRRIDRRGLANRAG